MSRGIRNQGCIAFGSIGSLAAKEQQVNAVDFFGKNMDHGVEVQKTLQMLPSWELTYPPPKACLKMIYPFPRWDMLIPWRVTNWNSATFWDSPFEVMVWMLHELWNWRLDNLADLCEKRKGLGIP